MFCAIMLHLKKKQVNYVPKTKTLRLKKQRWVKEVIGGQ